MRVVRASSGARSFAKGRDFSVGIVGLGLIGGSIAKALKVSRACRRIVGIDVDAKTLRLARRELHTVGRDLSLLRPCDLIVLATPMDRIERDLVAVERAARERAVVVDVAGVKEPIVRGALARGLRRVDFIAGHPMAGTEHSGYEHARADLFAGRPFILIPALVSSRRSLRLAGRFVAALGARPVWMMQAEDHDEAMAVLSMLPHVVAYSLVHVLQRAMQRFDRAYPSDFLLRLAGPSLLDATRVAGSDPDHVSSLVLLNRTRVQEAIDDLIRDLKDWKSRLRERKKLKAYLSSARATRRRLWVIARPR